MVIQRNLGALFQRRILLILAKQIDAGVAPHERRCVRDFPCRPVARYPVVDANERREKDEDEEEDEDVGTYVSGSDFCFSGL